MKKGVVILAGVAALALCVPAVAQPNSRAVETIVIDNFDTPDEMDWTWEVQASRFATDGYPIIKSFEGIPNSLRPYRKSSDPTAQVLGVKSVFDRKGDNWFEIYPVDKDGNKYEIPFLGTVTQLDIWVWGANYLYYLEFLVRDADGRVHTIPAGNLQFEGWRELIVKVPTYIRQHSKLRSGPENMSFIGVRVRTDANEFVDDYMIYFDNFKYVTNTLSNIYDGYELRQADFGDDEGQGK